MLKPDDMRNSIHKALYSGRGRCSVCGQWRKLQMYDDGLNGRFCSECFDEVVDAEEFLESEGLVPAKGERKQERK
jgi:hypothetical protein